MDAIRNWFARPATLAFTIVAAVFVFVIAAIAAPIFFWALKVMFIAIDGVVQPWWDYWLK